VIGFELKELQVIPDGRPEQESVTEFDGPLIFVNVIITVPVAP
jgi:hypothetical protein